MYHKYIIIAVLFLMGAYFVLNYSSADFREALTMPKNKNSNSNCPNILIQKGSKIYLYNSSKHMVPGVNPITFNNLEEYVQFTNWQRSVGMMCPVLFLQHTENAQGESVYKIRPGPTDLQGGLPPVTNPNALPPPRKHITKLLDASRDDPPFNVNSYPGYDASNMDQGEFTPDMMLDYIQQSTGLSPNPMDTNWGGADFTQALIDAGYYADNNVSIAVGS
jgi:hypothetical protein